ncbi:MAG: hypothetical protein EOM80_04380 [Erysipelotrichia bacterium]|nr:hypothetical protein [Erysipelotrichia bacterium]
MKQQEKVINQTLLIWCGVVIIEVFVIAHLMQFPGLVFAAFIMYWPVKAALEWPAPRAEIDVDAPKTPVTEVR